MAYHHAGCCLFKRNGSPAINQRRSNICKAERTVWSICYYLAYLISMTPNSKKIVITGTLSAASAPKVLILARENELGYWADKLVCTQTKIKVIRRTPCLYFTLYKCVYNLGFIIIIFFSKSLPFFILMTKFLSIVSVNLLSALY